MKEVFLEHSLNLLKKEYNYSTEELDRVKYGLEIIYISITKMSVILIIAALINSFKDTLLFFIIISPLRSISYGIHAKKSWQCYIFSVLIFILFPCVFINLNFKYNIIEKILIMIFTIISMLLFSPADTYKRPLVNSKHRKKLKIISLAITITYNFLILIIKNNYIINLIILALITQSILINPFTYKIFNMPYNNYKTYNKDAANLQK